jgi:hypothetical protein
MAGESIEEGEEGSVVYFAATSGPTDALAENTFLDGTATRGIDVARATADQQVLTLSKLKTLEYRIYRKLREKLKTHASLTHEGRSSRKFADFKKEVQQLAEGYSTPYHLSYYFTVG